MTRRLAHAVISYGPNLKWQRLAALVVAGVLLQEIPALCGTTEFEPTVTEH